MKTGLKPFYLFTLIISSLFFSCESYLRWDFPEVVRIDEYISTCNDSYVWIDGNTYYPNDSLATFLISGEERDTLITLHISWGALTGTDVIVACDSYTWINGIT